MRSKSTSWLDVTALARPRLQTYVVVVFMLFLFVRMVPWTLAQADVDAAVDEQTDASSQDDTDTQGLLEDLGSPDVAVREHATRQLMRDHALGRDDLIKMYRRTTLEEQRQRILRVARHHAIRRLARQAIAGQLDRGSVGVMHDPVSNSELTTILADVPDSEHYVGGIYIRDTLAGFPGYVELQADDVILAIDGKPLEQNVSRMDFGEMIEQRDAGTRIHFTILREGRIEDVSLILASQTAMREIYSQSHARPNDSIEGFWRIWKRSIVNPD